MEKEDKNNSSEITLLRDSEWSVIDGEPCRVIKFIPWASIKDGEIIAPNRTEPYASVILECKKLPQKMRGFITHKIDFENLWAAFKGIWLGQNGEVIIIWSKKHLKTYAKIFSVFMPKLWVMVCHKGALEIMTDLSYRPELTGIERWNAMKPIMDWKPKVME